MPSTSTDRLYGLTTSVAVKAPVRAVTSAVIVLSGLQSIGGVSLADGDRVLVKDQSDQTQNGIYLASSSDWQRAKDFDGNLDAVKGTLVVTDGVSTALLFYRLTTNDPVIIGSSAITFVQASEVQNPYPRTPAELAASVTPANYAYLPRPLIDASRYGFAESASAAANTTAYNNALAVAAAQTNGGLVILPAGNFSMNKPNAIPAYVQVRGVGNRATKLNFTAAGNFITLGGTAGALYYGTGISDVGIFMTDTGGEAIRCQGTQGAKVERLYVEGAGGAGGLGFGVVIDGGNASSFMNHIRDVQCNHIGNSFLMTTTGSQACTQTHFSNCYAAVADGGSSVGFAVTGGVGNGNGTVWLGGDIEDCGTGVSIVTSTGGVTFHGTRFETNTVDILFAATPNACSFIGCVNLTTITDNSGTGYNNHTFVGCMNALGFLIPNKLNGTTNFVASVGTSDIPVNIVGYPGQTSNVFSVKNSSNVEQFGIAPNGKITIAGQATTGAQTATFTAANKPGSGTTAPSKWLPVNLDGTVYYIPAWT